MTIRLIAAYVAWLLAAVALGVLFGSLVGELAALIGLVDSQSTDQRRVVEIAAIIAFIVLALLPFVLRRRLLRAEDNQGPDPPT